MTRRVYNAATLERGPTLPYLEQGDPSSIPVVLLHGLTDSWRTFELVLEKLPAAIRAIAVTQRGHGEATKPETSYAIEDFSSDLARFLDALTIDAAVIAGHSSHALVAQRFAIDHPERVAGLVLIGSPARMRDKTQVRDLLLTIRGLEDPIDPEFVRGFTVGTGGSRAPKAFVEMMIGEALKVPARVWRAAFESLAAADLAGQLDRIAAPTILIWGEQDPICSREDQESILHEIARARLIAYPNIGHSPHWEAPGRVAADIASFVPESSI